MPNLRGASPVGHDDRGRSYAALTIGGGELGRRVVVEAGFPSSRREAGYLGPHELMAVSNWITRAGNVEEGQITVRGKSSEAVD